MADLTVDANFTDSTTTITVVDSSGAVTNNLYVTEQGEILTVTDAPTGTTITVTRGSEGSEAEAGVTTDVLRDLGVTALDKVTENFDTADDGRFVIGPESDSVTIVPAGGGGGHALVKSEGTTIDNGIFRLLQRYPSTATLLRVKITGYFPDDPLNGNGRYVLGFTPNLYGQAKNGDNPRIQNFYGIKINSSTGAVNEEYETCISQAYNTHSAANVFTPAHSTEFTVEFIISRESSVDRFNGWADGARLATHDESFGTYDDMRERGVYPFVASSGSFQASDQKMQVRKMEVWSDVAPVAESDFETDASSYVDSSTARGVDMYTTVGGTTPSSDDGVVRALIGEVMDTPGHSHFRWARDISTPPDRRNNEFPRDSDLTVVAPGVDFETGGTLVSSDASGSQVSVQEVSNDYYLIGIAGKLNSGADATDDQIFPFADGTTLRILLEGNSTTWDVKIVHEGTTYDTGKSVAVSTNFFVVAWYDGTDLKYWVNNGKGPGTEASVGDLTLASAGIFIPDNSGPFPDFMMNARYSGGRPLFGGEDDVLKLVDRWANRYGYPTSADVGPGAIFNPSIIGSAVVDSGIIVS